MISGSEFDLTVTTELLVDELDLREFVESMVSCLSVLSELSLLLLGSVDMLETVDNEDCEEETLPVSDKWSLLGLCVLSKERSLYRAGGGRTMPPEEMAVSEVSTLEGSLSALEDT